MVEASTREKEENQYTIGTLQNENCYITDNSQTA